MHMHKIKLVSRNELFFVHTTLVIAIGLQILVWYLSKDSLAILPHFIMIVAEIVLLSITSFRSLARMSGESLIHRASSFSLLAVITASNIGSLILVVKDLISHSKILTGEELLISAIAIFLTNIIIFSFWYWEIDKPGLTGIRWSVHHKDFQFTQHDLPNEYPNWQPAYIDYLYLSLTNAINFAAADAKPLTPSAKSLMGLQALVSVFTLALVVARSVSILG